ncbi:MAG: hypothetical protein M0Z31_03905 [Clostridia bacterium]|nr:hypothetical protein [Clostridia bacterium]
MQNSIWLYRIYDIAEEIKLDIAESIIAQRKPTSRLRLSRIRPESIQIKNPPVSVDLDREEINLGNYSLTGEFSARIHDLGVVSIVLRLLLPEHITHPELAILAHYLDNHYDEINPFFIGKLKDMETLLGPALIKARTSGYQEDFTIFTFRHWPENWDPVPLLLADQGPFSEQTNRETMAHSFSYTPNDRAIITWDSAFIYDPAGVTDIHDLLEFATVQLLELRYYDGLLTEEMNKMYNSLAQAEKATRYDRLRLYRGIMKHLMELVADISEITERVQNALKVTEDVFYARIYGTAVNIFRTRQWMENIQHKITVIQRSYSMMSDEIISRRSLWLETAIVLLIVLDIILGFLPIFK